MSQLIWETCPNTDCRWDLTTEERGGCCWVIWRTACQLVYKQLWDADVQLWKCFIQKRKSSLLDHHLGDLEVTYALHLARWKARGWLPIHHHWTFFASSYCWDVTCGNLSTWAIFEGRGSLWSPIKDVRGCRPPTTVGWQKTRRNALSCGIKISPVGTLD